MVAGRGVDNAVGASPHDIRDAIPEAVADIRETRLSTLIFDGIMQKGRCTWQGPPRRCASNWAFRSCPPSNAGWRRPWILRAERSVMLEV